MELVPSATNRNFPAGSIASETGFGSARRLPDCVTFPSEPIAKVAIPGFLAFGHWLLLLKITKTNVPAGFVTIPAGDPFSRHFSLAVSFVGLPIGEIWPLFNVKANVCSAEDPWLPTISNPSVEELKLLPHANKNPIDTSPSIAPSSPNRFDILSFFSMFGMRIARTHAPGARRRVLMI